MASRSPMPVTVASFALGARRRNVTFPSAEISGDFTAGPRPGWPYSDAAAKKHNKVFIGVYAITAFAAALQTSAGRSGTVRPQLPVEAYRALRLMNRSEAFVDSQCLSSRQAAPR